MKIIIADDSKKAINNLQNSLKISFPDVVIKTCHIDTQQVELSVKELRATVSLNQNETVVLLLDEDMGDISGTSIYTEFQSKYSNIHFISTTAGDVKPGWATYHFGGKFDLTNPRNQEKLESLIKNI